MFKCSQILLLLPPNFQGETRVKDNVWFTYKARIQAHKRLEWLDFHSQLLLVWYAILSAVLGVVTIRYNHVLGPDTDVLATVLSVALLGVSLAVTNRDFRARALAMRRNYLELQRLYMEISSAGNSSADQIHRYDALLNDCENHRDVDDRIARVFATGLTSRKPSTFEQFSAIGWLTLRFIITILLYSLPLFFGFSMWAAA